MRAPGTGVPVQGSQISVSAHPDNVNAVRVRTANDANAVADRAFHVAVLC